VDPTVQAFDRLDDWRHFPDYQLERRSDIFFSLYLAEALEAKLGYGVSQELVPEFPVRIGSIFSDLRARGRKKNHSKKIDYLALSADGQTPILVELKTDAASRRAVQDEYLLAAQSVGFPALLEGLLDLFRASTAKRKYFCLLQQLQRMGLLTLPPALVDIMAAESLRGARLASRSAHVTSTPLAQPRIVYVQPFGDGPDCIGFQSFAEVVERHLDPVSQRFAASLREWATEPA
jgi:hypothetical protein